MKNNEYNSDNQYSDYKHIIYDKFAKFTINPKMNPKDVICFRNFIDSITSGFNYSNTFFWSYDKEQCCLIINNETEKAEADIFNQFVVLVFWLQEHKYKLSGSFNYQIDKLLGKIYVTNNQTIYHQIRFDSLNPLSKPNEIKNIKQNDNVNKEIVTIKCKPNEDLKHIIKINKFIRSICTFIGLVSIGSLILIIHANQI